MISGTTKVCGVMANPVGHSMSPLLHNFLAEKTGTDMVYVPFHVEADVKATLRGAYALHVAGMNVTIPYKQAVMPYLEEIDKDAEAIGAVNTLVRHKNGYKGHNTDAAGLLRAMKEEGISIENQSCILVGAGGAAKAAAYVLAREGAKEIYILNRNPKRAQALAEEIGARFGDCKILGMAMEEYGQLPDKRYLAIQCTSVGMHPHGDAAAVENQDFYQKIHTGVEIIYTPMETRFMKYVSAAGGKTMNGLSMLIYQGVAAFEMWNPDVKVDGQTIAEAKELMISRLKGRESAYEKT